MTVHDILTDYLTKEVVEKNGQTLPAVNEPLLDSQGGVIDSLSLWPLIVFVETRFGIRIEDTDLMQENFQTLQKLVDFIESKEPELRG